MRYIKGLNKNANSRKSKFAVIPDLHAINFPRGKQRVDDSGSSMSAEAIFEVKTYYANNKNYGSGDQSLTPPNRRAARVVQEYRDKLKALDKEFASDVVGDGNDGVTGPFTTAQSRFFRGQVIPLVSGWFGEIGTDFEKVLAILAREAASSDFGRTLSPLINTKKKGGAFPMLLQQFRRAVAVGIVRGNALLKMSRLHYVRNTAEEARHAHRANLSSNKYRPGKRNYSWYSEFAAPGYDSFQQFRNGRAFHMSWS